MSIETELLALLDARERTARQLDALDEEIAVATAFLRGTVERQDPVIVGRYILRHEDVGLARPRLTIERATLARDWLVR